MSFFRIKNVVWVCLVFCFNLFWFVIFCVRFNSILNDDYPGTQKSSSKKVYLTLALFTLLGSWVLGLMQKKLPFDMVQMVGRSRLESLAIASSCRYLLNSVRSNPFPLFNHSHSLATPSSPLLAWTGRRTRGLHCNNKFFTIKIKKGYQLGSLQSIFFLDP